MKAQEEKEIRETISALLNSLHGKQLDQVWQLAYDLAKKQSLAREKKKRKGAKYADFDPLTE